MEYWGEYIPVAERRRNAKKKMKKLRKKGRNISPVEIEGRIIAKSFWGKSWCNHLEYFSDYDNRLPRGRTYARNGSICHLEISSGMIKAIVSGSELYNITVTIKKLPNKKWTAIKKKCSGQIGSLLELLQGNISDAVMEVVSDERTGLFPLEDEIEFDCSCPDWAYMCKHVAAVLYGVGNRLDYSPELLFLLQGVSPEELLPSEITIPSADDISTSLDTNLEDIFGIEIDNNATPSITVPPVTIEVKDEVFTGKSISSMRNSLKLSVAEFAKKLSITPASVYRWESSKKPLNLRKKTQNALKELFSKKQKKKRLAKSRKKKTKA